LLHSIVAFAKTRLKFVVMLRSDVKFIILLTTLHVPFTVLLLEQS